MYFLGVWRIVEGEGQVGGRGMAGKRECGERDGFGVLFEVRVCFIFFYIFMSSVVL